MITTKTPTGLDDIAARVRAGERLSYEDGVLLFESPDIFTIGRLADEVRRRLHGRAAYYNINRHINYSNYCVLRCKFCSFYRPYPTGKNAAGQTKTDDAATQAGISSGGSDIHLSLLHDAPADEYEYSVEEIAEQAKAAADYGATEVHIVGGLHPKLPFEYYLDMCRAIREAAPALHIKAFTAIEIIHFGRIAKPRLSIAEVLTQLRDAGLGSLPGGGAEIFDDRVHDEAFRNKVGEEGWFDVHRNAHDLGIPSNATMLYGHIERPAERVTHMVKIREHQDESLARGKAAFNCFIPLSFIPDGSEFDDRPGPTGLDDLKTLAISRLMLDNISHIKAFWIMQSAKLAQMSLSWGVDDIDGTVVQYDITKREGGSGNRHQELTVDALTRLIHEAGFDPIERETLYRRVRRDGAAWSIVD